MRNVIGEKLGEAHPESIIIVCGHLDCTSEDPYVDAPGAEDNGTGTAVVLEAARAFGEFPCDLTVRFVTFSGEEQGLIGSDLYAAYAQSHGEIIAAVINVDMVGYSGPYAQDMYIFSDQNSHALGALGASIIDQYTNLDTLPVYETNPRYGSDHYPFAIRGYSAIFFIDAWFGYDWYPYYHTSADTVGNLNMAQQVGIGQAAAAMAAVLARPDFGPQYLAGDANANGQVNGLDVVYLVNFLKGGPRPPEPFLRGDANGNCEVNGLDVIYLVNFLKGLGAAPFYGDCR
jgi:Zn-dependent M28 family amino/carboxypeptidase